MSRTWKIVIGVVVIVVLLGVAGVITAQLRGGGPQIDTATVESVDLSVSVTASGKVEAGRRADVYAPTQGTLSDVFVVDGQKVKAGQKLAQMNTGPLLVAVDQASAGVEQAEAQLEQINNQAPAGADITAAQANVNSAQAAVRAARVQVAGASAPASQQVKAANAAVQAAEVAEHNALLAYQAAKHAVDTSSHPTPAAIAAEQQAQTGYYQAKSATASAKASRKALISNNLPVANAQARAGLRQSQAALATAQANLSKLQRTSVTEQRQAANAAKKQSQQALQVAQTALDEATLVAPIDGTVFFDNLGAPTATGSIQKASVGVGVSPALPVFTVVDLTGSTFVAEVDEADIARVKPKQTATIQFDAYPDRTVKTTVTRVQPAARTTATGGTVFPVDLGLADVGIEVLIGMKGDATIKVKSVPTAIVIPIEALFDENGNTFVYVVENGTKLKKTDITVGATTDTQVQVVKGLQPGQVVALSGATQFTDGMAVRVKK